jgi:hypothetical protein
LSSRKSSLVHGLRTTVFFFRILLLFLFSGSQDPSFLRAGRRRFRTNS